MKKILLVALLCLGAFSVSAQNRGDLEWFFGTGAGVNIGFDGQRFDQRITSHAGAGTAINLYGGRWFGRVVGLRGGYQGISISNHFTDYGQVGFHYVHADFLVRVAQAFVPYIHTGFLWMDAGSPTFGAGIMAPIRVGGHVSIVPDVRYTFLNGHAFKDGEVHFAGALTASLGVRFDFGRPISKKRAAAAAKEEMKVKTTKKPGKATTPAAPVPVPAVTERQEPVTVYVRDTIYVHQTTVVMDSAPAVPKALPGVVPVMFDENSSALSPNASMQLETVLSYLKQESGVHAVLTAFRGNGGIDEYATWLSERQLQSVRDYLEQHGIPSSRLETSYKSTSDTKGKVEIGFVRE